MARVRALHPDFGLFWPSPRFVRKLCIAAAFLAGGAIAGTQGILLLSGEDEGDARSAFALAPAESPVPRTGSGATVERPLPSAPVTLSPSATLTPPPRAEPKVIRVERKPMQSVEPKIVSRPGSPCRSESALDGNCAVTERTAPAAASDWVGPLAAPPAQVSTAPTLPENATPSLPAVSTPSTPESTPETIITAVPPQTVVRHPAYHSRRVTREVSRGRSESSRSYSYHPARQAGGYAGLW